MKKPLKVENKAFVQLKRQDVIKAQGIGRQKEIEYSPF